MTDCTETLVCHHLHCDPLGRAGRQLASTYLADDLCSDIRYVT